MKKVLSLLIFLLPMISVSFSQGKKYHDKNDKDKTKEDKYIHSEYCGSFLTLLENDAPAKEDFILEESSSKTSDGGSSVFLKVSAKKSKVVKNLSSDDNDSPDSLVISDSEIQVYPNPVTNQLTIKINLSSKEKLTFALYDYNGNLIKKIENIKPVSETIVRREDLKAGDYIYKIFSNTKVLASGRLSVN